MKNFIQLSILLISILFCTSCTTAAYMTSTAVTNATVLVGTAIITAPFKIIGAMSDDDDDDDDDDENN